MTETTNRGWLERSLAWIERTGNRLPDPALLFLAFLILTWIASALLAPIQFTDVHTEHRRTDPRRQSTHARRAGVLPPESGPHVHRVCAPLESSWSHFLALASPNTPGSSIPRSRAC